MLFYYLFLIASIFLGVIGQIALKSGAGRTETFIQQSTEPLTLIGLSIYAMAAVCYMVAIRKIPLSVAFPSVSASYVIVSIAAHFLWNEPLGVQQLLGLALIAGGIYLLHQ